MYYYNVLTIEWQTATYTFLLKSRCSYTYMDETSRVALSVSYPSVLFFAPNSNPVIETQFIAKNQTQEVLYKSTYAYHLEEYCKLIESLYRFLLRYRTSNLGMGYKNNIDIKQFSGDIIPHALHTTNVYLKYIQLSNYKLVSKYISKFISDNLYSSVP